MISRDLVYIGPSANQVRAADLEPELVFGLGLNDDLANQESDQTRVHDMAKVHLDIYKGKIYVTFSSLSVGIVCLSALAPACLVCPCPCLSCLPLPLLVLSRLVSLSVRLSVTETDRGRVYRPSSSTT